MIEQINVKNIATYNEIGVSFENMKLINFIYGGNGSGKTTISNYLKSPLSPIYSSCSIDWDKDGELPILVYNKTFREENFSTGKIRGVFTLGKATKEELELIENKKKLLSEAIETDRNYSSSIEKLTTDLNDQMMSFKDLIWNQIYKKYETSLKEVFRGYMVKQKLVDKFLTEASKPDHQIDSPINDIIEKYNTLFLKENAVEIILISSVPINLVTEIENNKLWGTKIIGVEDVPISKLIRHLNMSDWINAGRSYIQSNSNICPFCQKGTITDEFKKQLSDFFDATYNESVKTIKALSDNYLTESDNILSFLRGILSREKNNPNTKLNIEEFEIAISDLSNSISNNRNLIANKVAEPSRSVILENNSGRLSKISSIIQIANSAISKHNQLIENINTEKKQLILLAWQFFCTSFKNETNAYLQKTKGLQRGITNLNTKHNKQLLLIKGLKREIEDLSKNITSVQPAIDEINRTLTAYGITSFHIRPFDSDANQYQICRSDGSTALSTLSEGEITFITFLYFMQLSKGSLNENNITDNRIIVIDDPISSLDSSILFVVSSLIKELIKRIKSGDSNIKQLILLTHNVYFHKEVSFIDGRTHANGATHYWVLRKSNNITALTAHEQNNPISSSYELLWKEVRQKGINSIITIQNVMRRIIETYFKILGKYGDDDLIHKFPSFEEQEICRSLLCWINDGSHCLPDDLFLEAPEDTIEKFYKVFKDIFVHTNHLAHYEMMMNPNL